MAGGHAKVDALKGIASLPGSAAVVRDGKLATDRHGEIGVSVIDTAVARGRLVVLGFCTDGFFYGPGFAAVEASGLGLSQSTLWLVGLNL